MKKIFAILLLSLTLSVSAAEIPLDAKLDYNQGIDFYKLGMYEKAIESFRSAVKAYPDYIDAYYNLGTVLEYLKQYSEAISIFKQVYLRNPNDYEAIYKLAYLNAKIGDNKKALEYAKLIPQSSTFYAKGQELSKNIILTTEIPEQEEITPSTISNKSGIYENIVSPTGITTDKNSNIYVATFSDNAIIKISPDKKRQVFVKSDMINGPISLASDNLGNIYVSNYNANNVLKITQNGTVSVLMSKLDRPYGLHIEGNMLFITCQGSNSVYRKKLSK